MPAPSKQSSAQTGAGDSLAKTPNSKWKRLMPAVLLLGTVVAVVAAVSAPTAVPAAPVTRVTVVNSYPHDVTSFSQGLVVHRGALLEGTGHYNKSKLRLVTLETGQPVVNIDLPGDVFGEGVTVWNDTIIQLTWQNGYVILYDAESFQRTGTVAMRDIDRSLREGWGITHNNEHLIISDGSSVLRFVDPSTFRTVRRLRVKDGLRPITKLNELEYVKGEILANVWYRDHIARIDPQSGRVKGWLDLTGVRPASVRGKRESVLNGIAWDENNGRLFVTGKNWPRVFEIRF